MNKSILNIGKAAIILALTVFMGTSCSKDDEDNSTPLASYENADLAGKWTSSKYSFDVYVLLNEDGTGEMADAAEDKYDITWEMSTLTLDSMDYSTFEQVEYEVSGVIVTDEEGYFYELSIITEDGKIVSLKDVDNSITYKKASTNGDDNSDDNGDDTPAASAYTTSDLARKWLSDAYSIDVYVNLQLDGTGVSTDPNGDSENITWEFTKITVEDMDPNTGAMTSTEFEAVKVIDSEGYYVELQIKETDGVISALKDLDNKITYKRTDIDNN